MGDISAGEGEGNIPRLFNTIVKIGILYLCEIQYALLGILNMNVPSPTI